MPHDPPASGFAQHPCSPSINTHRNALLTAEETAEFLRMHPSTVRRLLRQGKLPGSRIGRDWRVPAHSLPGTPPLIGS